MQRLLGLAVFLLGLATVAFATPLTLTPSIPSNFTIKANTSLIFTADGPLGPTGMSFVAPFCSLSAPTQTGQTVKATLLSCAYQGSFPLTVTVQDALGNTSTCVVNYIYDTVAPEFDDPGSYYVSNNSIFTFTASEVIQFPTFTAPDCIFDTPIVTGATISFTLTNCSVNDTSFGVTISAFDMAGNFGTRDYVWYYSTSDTIGPTFTPNLAADSAITTNAWTLTFNVSEWIQSVGISVTSPNCTFNVPTVSGLTITSVLYSCSMSGDIPLEISAYDMVGNIGTFAINYEWSSAVVQSSVPINTYVFPNTPFVITSNAYMNLSRSHDLTAPCTFTPWVYTPQATLSATLLSCTEGPFLLDVYFFEQTYGRYWRGMFPYVYDTLPPILTPYIAANSAVKPNTLLSFYANEAITDFNMTSPNCTFDAPTLTGDILTAKLLSCAQEGPFYVNITAMDAVNNTGTSIIRYTYAPPALVPQLANNSRVKGNTPFLFIADVQVQPSSINLVSPNCTFDSPTLVGQTNVTTTLLGCSTDGPFSVAITVLDLIGNNGTSTFEYVYDPVGPSFIPFVAPNSQVNANTPLSFTANKVILPTNITFNALGCTFGTPTLMDQTTTAYFVHCTTEGAFLLNVTALDEVGTAGTLMISYVYSTQSSTLFTPAVGANTKVAAGTVLSFTASKVIQSSGIQFTSPSCLFGTPSLAGKTVTATLTSCTQAGTFLLTITALDSLGGTTSYSINYFYDASGVVLIPSVKTSSQVIPNTVLSFNANKAIQSTGITFDAPGCNFNTPTLLGQTVSATLLNCAAEGFISLKITVSDSLGNPSTLVFDYVYGAVTTLNPYLTADSLVKPNTTLSFTASKEIQPNNITFVSSTCTFDTPTLTGQVVTATLLNCTKEGNNSLTITIVDVAGNNGTFEVDYVYDSLAPTVVLSSNYTLLKPNSDLVFTANEPIQTTNITIQSVGCIYSTPNVTGQVVTTTVISCAEQGPFALNITALDTIGNVGLQALDFEYDSIGPAFSPLLEAEERVRANTVLHFTANKLIQATNATFAAPNCTFDTPTLVHQTITANLINCSQGGTMTMEITVLDVAGNAGSFVISYNYIAVEKLDNITTNITLFGNYTVSPNDTVSITQGSKATVQDCLTLNGQLVVVGSSRTAGESDMLFSSQCLQGEFNGVVLQNPTSDVCGVEPKYSAFDMTVHYTSCSALSVGAIAGITVGSVACLAIIVVIILFLTPCMRKKVFPNRRRAVDMNTIEMETAAEKRKAITEFQNVSFNDRNANPLYEGL